MSVSCPCRIPDPAYVLPLSLYCLVHVLAQFTAHLQLVPVIFHVVQELAAERSDVTVFLLWGFGGVGPAYLCVLAQLIVRGVLQGTVQGGKTVLTINYAFL